MGMGVGMATPASLAHVRAIARADDAAVAITCARGYVRRYMANAHVRYISIDAKRRGM